MLVWVKNLSKQIIGGNECLMKLPLILKLKHPVTTKYRYVLIEHLNKFILKIVCLQVNRIDTEGVEITNKSYSMKKIRENQTEMTYGNFLKSATLLANTGVEEDINGHTSTRDIEIKPSKYWFLR